MSDDAWDAATRANLRARHGAELDDDTLDDAVRAAALFRGFGQALPRESLTNGDPPHPAPPRPPKSFLPHSASRDDGAKDGT